jgi:hypothetical protein
LKGLQTVGATTWANPGPGSFHSFSMSRPPCFFFNFFLYQKWPYLPRFVITLFHLHQYKIILVLVAHGGILPDKFCSTSSQRHPSRSSLQIDPDLLGPGQGNHGRVPRVTGHPRDVTIGTAPQGHDEHRSSARFHL